MGQPVSSGLVGPVFPAGERVGEELAGGRGFYVNVQGVLWERGGRFSQRHAGTGSSQLAAGEVTATLLGGCAHSKRPGRGARPLLLSTGETHPDSTEKAFNEPWSSRSQAPPARSFNKYSAKKSGGLAGRQRAGAVTTHTTTEAPSGHAIHARVPAQHTDTHRHPGEVTHTGPMQTHGYTIAHAPTDCASGPGLGVWGALSWP